MLTVLEHLRFNCKTTLLLYLSIPLKLGAESGKSWIFLSNLYKPKTILDIKRAENKGTAELKYIFFNPHAELDIGFAWQIYILKFFE